MCREIFDSQGKSFAAGFLALTTGDKELDFNSLVDCYEQGPARLRAAIEGLSPSQIDATPIAGTWSIRQIICHLADAEILYADRMKRILAEEKPILTRAEPKEYLAALAVRARVIDDELLLIDSIRRHMACILRSIPVEKIERIGIHSTDGPLTLSAVLERATSHIPHHLQFIQRKKQLLLSENA